ncbi:hypothetical protein A3C09_02680 [Candidatus Uhrbacteria bacterium RIFCSPHIGHO2_02_FULL_47_44]|uniref:t-SNARE coiled-coil homology domain-containing protein n=1 Tax=Candidatus Uhrbacteria bacterium RIFCSPLOWO2_02_FULL_48_18 TaxID=1802408 RepID=A0A1F7V8K6_9BACT|nr:MAG: hypothetical protein A2839_00080 [Candidatus Uhrbacteria bacterium RIFCSPHIGHO2_01_FULL_47_10]OGL70205.1 MAG: hypothetical protein A3C09_02680 [Candidatus Uhrbacteria bacterium RIFCSPHIGHO2_02_FULL_47_44]OGL77113.1 MAG: hypothetical protein A3E97_03425 [Candidatus Uhrbacteria bacterium RIFCSPHIGHO2_12_FULL_47_12]OGL80454.1 MAG: hypothetical protein A3B20_03525 [Candidatus Uhrbacteria bacterium RIFCSPLOWO2_01_FULL_47_17]OGL86314.1 MAG: hypothetical protein A3I41_02005 [Candidatus Uhrbact
MDKTLTTEQRFEHVDHQFGVIDKRSERTEFRTNQRINLIEDRLDRHDLNFLELKNSITDLAIMTKNQFDHVYEQFDKVDNRFNQVDKRFDTLESLMKKGFERTDKLEGRFDRLEGRFDKLEALVKRGFERTDRLEALMKKGFGMA